MTASSLRRILSVWLRRLPTDRIERASRAPDNSPLVLTAAIKSAQRIVALNDSSAALGLRMGMALADARAMYPGLKALEAEPDEDRRLLDAIADWCDRYTPLVGLDSPDGLFLDVSGCAHLFGGEAVLARDLTQRLRVQGLRSRAAIADSTGCAWALARYGDCAIAPPGVLREVLLPLPLAALRLDADILEPLKTAGLLKVRDIIDLPRAPLAARFGNDLLQRLDQATGREDESIVPRLPVPSYVVERRFADPIGREEDVLGTLEHLAQELARAMERHGEGACCLQAALFRVDGKVVRIEIGTGEPIREPARILRLFIDRLASLADECDPGFGFDVVRLAALATARLDPTQAGLGNTGDHAELSHLIDRLSTRFGAQRIRRLVAQDTHIPEYAVMEIPAQMARPQQIIQETDEASQDTLLPARPLRLFAHPEPVTDAIAEVPDGPPVRFRWRHVLHEIVQAEGPERIAMQWWRDAQGSALTRDYFRVQSRDGLRAWLYREGLYGREPGQPRWFVHGLFA